MREQRVAFAPEAADDLLALYDWISTEATPDVALRYVGRLEAFCARLSLGAERGTLRSDVRKGLRILGFERRVTLAFTVDDATVTVLRVFTAGRDWERDL